ncbi:hypothetical protein [Novosphingobium sp. 9]|uniref:hypothetical protein n=1 Tax=Novosphingobium sp. 9 TaxID=2025349 RepID=UPI0021B6604F|nr:hypothetical protein [Novosphingobium sp. 9]
MRATDPAKGRFFALQALRLGGVALVIIGLLLAEGRLGMVTGDGARYGGYALLLLGLVAIFLLPALLIRRWKSPE